MVSLGSKGPKNKGFKKGSNRGSITVCGVPKKALRVQRLGIVYDLWVLGPFRYVLKEVNYLGVSGHRQP